MMQEARVTAEVMGMTTTLVADVGVAGLHRLLNQVGHCDSVTGGRMQLP